MMTARRPAPARASPGMCRRRASQGRSRAARRYDRGPEGAAMEPGTHDQDPAADQRDDGAPPPARGAGAPAVVANATEAGLVAGALTGGAIGASAGPVGGAIGAAVGAVVAGAGGGAAARAAEGEGVGGDVPGDPRALIGLDVVDAANEAVGEVAGLRADASGRPAFAVVTTGWLGFGPGRLVPLEALRSGSGQRLRLPFAAPALPHAPVAGGQERGDPATRT